MTKSRVCFYHKGCPDGIASAWCIKRKYPYSECNFVGVPPAVNELDESLYKKKRVYFVDVCSSEKVLKKVYEKAKSVTILDHHKTYKEMLDKFDTNAYNTKIKVIFDMNRAGCQMAWDYIEENIKRKLKKKENPIRPFFIEYIADRDLWKFSLENSKLVNTGLHDMGYMCFDKMDEMYEKWVSKSDKKFLTDTVIPRARITEEKNNKDIDIAVRYANRGKIDIDGKIYNVWLTSSPRHLRSDICNKLAKKQFSDGTQPDFAVNWTYDFPTKQWWISTRTVKNDIDLAKLCANFSDGGGHAKAAGFTIPSDSTLNDYFVYVKN